MLFDRICREKGIKHLLTAPRSPTTTGKGGRWYRSQSGEYQDFHNIWSLEPDDVPEATAAAGPLSPPTRLA